jgi:hypothetical protein
VKDRNKPSSAVSYEQHLMADQGSLSADTIIKVTADSGPSQHCQASRAIAGRLPRPCCGCWLLGGRRALLVLLQLHAAAHPAYAPHGQADHPQQQHEDEEDDEQRDQRDEQAARRQNVNVNCSIVRA